MDAADETDTRIAAGEVAPVDEATWAALDVRFRRVQRRITRTNIADVGHDVLRQLQRERDAALESSRTASGVVTSLSTRFSERWPAVAVRRPVTPSS